VGDLCVGRSQIGSTSVLSDRDLEYLEVEKGLTSSNNQRDAV